MGFKKDLQSENVTAHFQRILLTFGSMLALSEKEESMSISEGTLVKINTNKMNARVLAERLSFLALFASSYVTCSC